MSSHSQTDDERSNGRPTLRRRDLLCSLTAGSVLAAAGAASTGTAAAAAQTRVVYGYGGPAIEVITSTDTDSGGGVPEEDLSDISDREPIDQSQQPSVTVEDVDGHDRQDYGQYGYGGVATL